jgi:putative DNA primase/helicase
MTIATCASSPRSEGAVIEPEIDLDLYDELQLYHFLWPTVEDRSPAAQEGHINCLTYEQAGERRFVRDRQVIVAHQDTEEGERAARAVAQIALRNGACSAWLWAVPGFGTRFQTMREWVQVYSLVNTFALERAGQWKGFVGFVGTSSPEPPDFPEPPRPIAAGLIVVPPLEPEMIPEPFREWCLDISDRVWCPLEYVAGPLIVVLSGLIGRRIAIRPKRHDDWKAIPNLWGAIVGPPGSLKTPAIEEVCRPLKKLADEAMERHREDLAEFQEKSLVAAAKRTAARKSLDQAAKKRADDDELGALAREATVGTHASAPGAKRYLVNDITVEKLGELMAQDVNANGLIVFRDELVGLFKSLDRPGHEADRTFFLEAWNGSGSFTFDRIGRGTLHIPHACLALFGGIQPGPLTSYLRGTFSGEDRDGFTERFQVMMYPDPRIGFLNVDRRPNAEARERAVAIFRALDALEPAARGCKAGDDSGIPCLHFSDEAQEFFVEWRIGLERRLRSGNLPALMETHLSKYRSLHPSLALIFHLVDTYDRPSLEPVSLRAAEAAAAWCELLEVHAARVHQAAIDGDPDIAIRLSQRLKDSLPNPFTFRQVAQKGWAGLGTVEEVRRAVGILEDRHWVKVAEVPASERGGRPSEQVWVHPKVRAGEGGRS